MINVLTGYGEGRLQKNLGGEHFYDGKKNIEEIKVEEPVTSQTKKTSPPPSVAPQPPK